MARSAARLKMGYYPLPESEGANLRKLLTFTGPASAKLAAACTPPRGRCLPAVARMWPRIGA